MDTVCRGNIELAKVLVARGADPDLGDSYGFTPLMMACRVAQKDAVGFLLSLGVNVNAQDNTKRTALDIVEHMQRPPDLAPEVIERFIEMGQSMGPPPELLKDIAALLKRAGGKTSAKARGSKTVMQPSSGKDKRK